MFTAEITESTEKILEVIFRVRRVSVVNRFFQLQRRQFVSPAPKHKWRNYG
jgi:hypothetical protein